MKNLLKHFRWRDVLTILSFFLALVAVLAIGVALAKLFNVAFADWLLHGEAPVRIPN